MGLFGLGNHNWISKGLLLSLGSGITPELLKGTYEMPGVKHNWQCTRQVPYMLYMLYYHDVLYVL